MQDQINQDLKAAMLAGEKEKADTLKMIKTALQMAAIDNKGDLSEDQALKILQKESKKRADAAEMFKKGGNEEKAQHEEREKQLIDSYLPQQMSEEEITKIVDEVLSSLDNPNMGQVMGQVMAKTGSSADGSMVSRIVREKLA